LPEDAKIQEYFRNHSQNIDTILLYLKAKQTTKSLTQGMLEGSSYFSFLWIFSDNRKRSANNRKD